tara:strand:+ start:302 stop:490 length:189 start_codon:yes stop_codon:yes gene_type:complete
MSKLRLPQAIQLRFQLFLGLINRVSLAGWTRPFPLDNLVCCTLSSQPGLPGKRGASPNHENY